MTGEEARRSVVEYWMAKSERALASARAEFQSKRYDFSANRAYYACFYAASAVLLKAGKKFIKHSGVRGAIHQHLVNTGLLDIKWGKVYDRIFENRQFADYIELFEFEEPQVSQMLSEAEGFLLEMKRLLGKV